MTKQYPPYGKEKQVLYSKCEQMPTFIDIFIWLDSEPNTQPPALQFQTLSIKRVNSATLFKFLHYGP